MNSLNWKETEKYDEQRAVAGRQLTADNLEIAQLGGKIVELVTRHVGKLIEKIRLLIW